MTDDVTVEVLADPEGTEVLRRALSVIHEDDGLPQVVELLQGAGDEAVGAALGWIERTRPDDPVLSWMLLYALDRAEVTGAVELYEREALRPVERDRDEGCHSPADRQALVGMMGAEALGHRAVAGEDGALDALVRVVAQQPEPAIRIEAGRAAFALDPSLEEQLRELLGEDAESLYWEVVDVATLLTADEDPVTEPRGEEPPEGSTEGSGRVVIDQRETRRED